jgi:DNA invertase Pin-like site-specific DNA recombinase
MDREGCLGTLRSRLWIRTSLCNAEALRLAGGRAIFEEKVSGMKKRDGRTELQKVLSVLVEGDVTRLDGLGRSIRNLANIAHEIERVGAHPKVIVQSVDTSSAAGRAFYGMLPVFAAFDRRQRQLEGIANTKRHGVCKGGGPRLHWLRVEELFSQGLGSVAIARELNFARSSVYRLLEQAVSGNTTRAA